MKGKNIFLKNDITGDVDSAGGMVKTFITFMKETIAEKNTADRARL